jgi:acetoin utilization protein AcuB
MKRDVVTASPEMTIERATHIIHERKIGALPVVHEGRLVGIITTTDLMQVLLSALGLGEETRRYSIVVRDRIGVLADVTRLMAQESINIRSIIFMPLEAYKDMWQIIIRVSVVDYDRAVATVQQANYKVVTEYVEDLTPYLPKG